MVSRSRAAASRRATARAAKPATQTASDSELRLGAGSHARALRSRLVNPATALALAGWVWRARAVDWNKWGLSPRAGGPHSARRQSGSEVRATAGPSDSETSMFRADLATARHEG